MGTPDTMLIELVEWESVRQDCKYPKSDNNNGYIYGINEIDADCGDIVEVSWYKTHDERVQAVEYLKTYNVIHMVD